MATNVIEATLEVGQEAPDFTLRDEQNQKWTLSAHRGQKIVLVFYPLSFSGICTQELHEITDRAASFGEQGAEVVGISIDSKYVQAAFKRHEGLEATLLADFNPRGEVARKYGVYLEELGFATRGTFVIDSDGKLAHKVVVEPTEKRDADGYIDALRACR